MKRNYACKSGRVAGILGQRKRESLKIRRKDNRLILLNKDMKSNVRIYSYTDDLIHKIRRSRNQHSAKFQAHTASKNIYECSFFPQTLRDWNGLPDSLTSYAEVSDDCV